MGVQHSFYEGMRVKSSSPKHPGFGRVTKVNRVNIDVEMDGGMKVRFGRTWLTPVALGEAPPLPATPVVQVVDLPLPVSTVVRVKLDRVAANSKLAGIWVVTGHYGDMARIYHLNTTDGTYWRVPHGWLVKAHVQITELD